MELEKQYIHSVNEEIEERLLCSSLFDIVKLTHTETDQYKLMREIKDIEDQNPFKTVRRNRPDKNVSLVNYTENDRSDVKGLYDVSYGDFYDFAAMNYTTIQNFKNIKNIDISVESEEIITDDQVKSDDSDVHYYHTGFYHYLITCTQLRTTVVINPFTVRNFISSRVEQLCQSPKRRALNLKYSVILRKDRCESKFKIDDLPIVVEGSITEWIDTISDIDHILSPYKNTTQRNILDMAHGDIRNILTELMIKGNTITSFEDDGKLKEVVTKLCNILAVDIEDTYDEDDNRNECYIPAHMTKELERDEIVRYDNIWVSKVKKIQNKDALVFEKIVSCKTKLHIVSVADSNNKHKKAVYIMESLYRWFMKFPFNEWGKYLNKQGRVILESGDDRLNTYNINDMIDDNTISIDHDTWLQAVKQSDLDLLELIDDDEAVSIFMSSVQNQALVTKGVFTDINTTYDLHPTIKMVMYTLNPKLITKVIQKVYNSIYRKSDNTYSSAELIQKEVIRAISLVAIVLMNSCDIQSSTVCCLNMD